MAPTSSGRGDLLCLQHWLHRHRGDTVRLTAPQPLSGQVQLYEWIRIPSSSFHPSYLKTKVYFRTSGVVAPCECLTQNPLVGITFHTCWYFTVEKADTRCLRNPVKSALLTAQGCQGTEMPGGGGGWGGNCSSSDTALHLVGHWIDSWLCRSLARPPLSSFVLSPDQSRGVTS